MATIDYINADLAISRSADTSKQPRRPKWPAVKKVLKSKGKQSNEELNSHRLELKTPDFHSTLIPFYQCFDDSVTIIKLLDELKDKDSRLTAQLDVGHPSRGPDPVRQTLDEDKEISFQIGPSLTSDVSVNSYMDFLTAFVSLFLQSRFLSDHAQVSPTDDPYHVLSSLAALQCPEGLYIFRRVCVNPHLVVSTHQEGKPPQLHKDVPVIHLAKFLDIVVINFLGSVTEHTAPAAVKWALDYLIQLLTELHSSMGLLGSPGWYGAPPIRSRKRTFTDRSSVTRPPALVPPMLAVNSFMLDPETGQPSPQPPGSPSQGHLIGGSPSSNNPFSLSPSHEGRGHVGSPGSPSLLFTSNEPTPGSSSPRPHPSPTRTGFGNLGLSGSHGDDLQTHHGRALRSLSPPPLSSIHEDTVQETFQEHSTAAESSDQCRSLSPSDEVRSKVVKSPDIPDVDRENELKTGMNEEGRVSLVAILTAIATLPQTENLWTSEIGDRCFSLIQLCMDIGLPPKTAAAPQPSASAQAQSRRQRFRAQDNPAFSKHGAEKPYLVHSRCVVEALVQALIQCATSLIVGCVNEGTQCSLLYLRLTKHRTFHTRLTRLLQRIADHSPSVFRQSLSKFSQPSNSSARKLFHFLHVILQYCSDSDQLQHRSDSLAVDIVVSVLRAAVDRLVNLDITEKSIQNSIVSEACSFFQYAHNILNECSLSHINGSAHLEMYLHRIALSVMLPPSPQKVESLPAPLSDAASPLVRRSQPNIAPPTNKTASLSNKKGSVLLPAVTARGPKLGGKTRSGSLSLPNESNSSKSKQNLRKQQSLHSDIGGVQLEETRNSLDFRPSGTSESLVGEGESKEEPEFRGLKVDLLRGRVQRLVVLLNTSVPGTVPDPDMLASLVDLCDGKTVVARAMVLLECAMFVRQLRTQELPTVWVIHNRERNAHLMHLVSHKLSKWGDAIGHKLRVIELRERELQNRLKLSNSPGCDGATSKVSAGEEEPVFPSNEEGQTDREYSVVSHAIKMAACQLLLEITRFLRDPPPHFCGWSINRVSRANSVFTDDMERKVSVSSVQSSDNESIHGGAGPTSLPIYDRQLTAPGRFGSTLSTNDGNRQGSMEESAGSASPTKKRVSVYLRVNSSGGTVSRSSSLRRAPKVIRVVDPPNAPPTLHSHPPRREAFSASNAAALHQTLYSSSTPRGGRRPSLAGLSAVTIASHHPLPTKYRRQSVAEPLFKPWDTDKASPVDTPPTKPSGGGVTLTNLRNRARKAMHTLRRRPTKARLNSETGPSPSSSPGHRRKLLTAVHRSSQAGSFSHSAPAPPEDRSMHCSWLRIIENLIIVEHSHPTAVRLKHQLACRELLTALRRVYWAKVSEVEEGGGVTKGSGMSRSLSLMFTHRISRQQSGMEGKGPLSMVGGTLRKQDSSGSSDTSSRRRSKQSQFPPRRVSSVPASLSSKRSSSTKSSDSFGYNFSSINFSRMSSLKLSSTPMRAGDSDDTIELFLESESIYPRAYLDAELDQCRREYLSSELPGMIHVPFSILVHAAPALHPSTLPRLKALAWDALLDTDTELSSAAGAFFLLACLKESSSGVRGFVREHIVKGSPSVQLEAILRFRVLWESRYHVWPRMEERAQKKLCVGDSKSDDDHKTIGYSLPASLLGHVADTLPLAPWDFSAVCTNKTCADNPNLCYHSTQHIPVVHSNEVSDRVKDYTVSGVSLLQEASSKPANVFLGIGMEDDDLGNIEKWEAVKTTLFPHSLLPLIRFVIMALLSPAPSHPHTSTPSQDTNAKLDKSEVARQVVWKCMLEDEYLFFQPLLDQFNKLYSYIKADTHQGSSADIEKLMAEILEPFHVLLQSFHSLPSRTAHFLFNNFMGVVMKHTDQPVVHSPRIIQSVLSLVGMVAPSVQGLDSKVIKNNLKKESCYTTVMTTARIRGTEKVYVTDLTGQNLYPVSDTMTFAKLIAMVNGYNRVSTELLNTWYLFDTGKDIPVLSSLYIQDQYSAPLDRQYPVFCLKGAEHSDHLWARQMDQLFVHKMSELMRVQFARQLLHTGPEIEKGVAYSEYAQPNYLFLYKELVELNSFPRKVLTSILQEAGQNALQHYPLHASDVMLKATWVRFVLELFKSVKPDFNWSNNMVLFLNVITGALLLHGENHALLRLCLVSLLTAATKFSSVFKRDGYQMIVPVFIQAHAIHMDNQLITDSLKFAWFHFYLLDGNTFLSQVVASASNLFSESVASLSTKVSSNYTPLPPPPPHMEGEVLRRYQVRAVFDLIHSLSGSPDSAYPPDHLDIMRSCQQNLDEACYSRLTSDLGHHLSLENVAALLITLATWNPEALRGVQVLVCMDHLILLFLKKFSATNTSLGTLAKSLEYLIKGCESVSRHHQFRRDISTRKGLRKGFSAATDPQTPGYPVDKTFNIQFDEAEEIKPKKTSRVRKVSAAIQQKFRILVNPNQKSPAGLQGNLSESSMAEREVRIREPPGARLGVQAVDQRAISSQFKLRRLQHESQQILQLARDSLLSIATQFVAHFAKVRISEVFPQRGSTVSRKISYTSLAATKQERSKVTFDSSTVSILTLVAIQLIKQGYYNDRYEGVLQGRGLTGFMTCFLPNIEWSEPYFPSFQNLLNRLLKFFKFLQKESNKAMMLWESLTGFISGITQTIHNSPVLVQGQEHNLQKLKSLLEVIVTVQHSSGGNPPNQSAPAKRYRQRIQTPLLQGAPVSFSEAVVGLAVELIVHTHTFSQTRLRYHLSDLLYHKIIKEHEKLLMSKIVLPVCIQLGLRDDLEHPCLRDAEFVLDYIDKNVDFVIKPNINPTLMDQKLPPDLFFRDLKVVCLSFSETFSLRHWHQISQWVISLTQRKAVTFTPATRPPILLNEDGGGARLSRLSSISTSSQSGINTVKQLGSFLSYHKHLLSFFESFLTLHHVPLLPLLSPLLRVQESQLQSILREVKSDSPALFEDVNQCIDKCHTLLSTSFNSVASVSRHQLLRRINEDLRHLAQPTRVQRSATSVNAVKPPSRKRNPRERRNSYTVSTQPPLSKIGEEDSEPDQLQTTTLPKKLELSPSPEHRPMSLKWKGKSVPKRYVPSVPSLLTDSDQGSGSHPRRPRRQAQRPKIKSLSTPDAPRQKRSPQLGLLGKLGSSEFHADTEDAGDPVTPPFSTRNPSFDDEYIIKNVGSLSSENSPVPPRSANDRGSSRGDNLATSPRMQSFLVSVEVHGNEGADDDQSANEEAGDDQPANTTTNSSVSLLSPENAAHGRGSQEGGRASPTYTHSLPSSVRQEAKQSNRMRKVSFSNEVRTASSLDRKSGKILGSALKESSKYVCLYDDTYDDT